MKTGYYLFDAGVNYRDDILGINELRDDKNLYWRGNLKKRLGYEQRNQTCTTPSTGQYPSSGMWIIDHIYMDGATAYDFIFMGLTDTGAATHAITVFQRAGLPMDTASTFTPIGAATFTQSSAGGVGQIVPWSLAGILSAVAFDGKIWFGLDDPNPYVLFYDGTSWTIHEVPMCQVGNTSAGNCTGSTDGYNIIPGSTDAADNGDWGGAKIIGAANDHLHVSDGRTAYYAPSEAGVRPDYGATYTGFYDRTSAVRGSIGTTLPGSPAFIPGYFYGLQEDLNIADVVPYKKYLFWYGEDGIISNYIRGIYKDDYDLVTESNTGAYGKMVATEKGIFFVGKDGIYGYDGQTATDLAKKVWPHIEDEVATLPDDLSSCSLAYHDGFIWVSFSGENNEVYIFDPDHIYDDDRGDSHAPMYRFIYRQNLIDVNPDCESVVYPMVMGETTAAKSGSSFTRSNDEAHAGTYAYRIKKLGASGAVDWISITDSRSSGDMHGLLPGLTYTWSAWYYTGSLAGSMPATAIHLSLGEAYGTGLQFLYTYSTHLAGADTWGKLSLTKTLNSGTSGVSLEVFRAADAEANDVCYIDDIKLTCDNIPKGTIDDDEDVSNMNKVFYKLREYENRLYGYNNEYLYELDASGFDEETTSESVGIDWDFKSAYHDQENPNTQKTYRQVSIETNEGIADGTTGGAYDFQFAASVEHSTGLEHRGIATGIDMEYTTDVSHVSKTMDIPETTGGYILDGNNISVELMGETNRVTPTTKAVDIFGYTLNWDLKDRAFEEVSS